MKSKLKIIIPLTLVLVLAGAYKFVIAKPAPAATPKVAGAVYVLPKEFLVNLSDGRFAKLGIGLVMAPGAHTAPAEGGHAVPADPPEGYGTLPQEGLVRDIVTNTLTDASGGQLISAEGRKRLKKQILDRLHRDTDVHADDVLFTDVAVQ